MSVSMIIEPTAAKVISAAMIAILKPFIFLSPEMVEIQYSSDSTGS